MIRTHRRVLRWTFAVVGLIVAGAVGADERIHAQAPPQKLPTELSNIRFNSGQSVVPYFEGWIRNPDGTFDLVFGYFNRNWEQELAIPAGPDNTVELGGPDSGQPTYFLPRRQRFVFRVRVPRDFGKKEVVWSITANGRTEHAFGSLIREQEITERVVVTNGGYDPGLSDPNRPPSLTVAPIQALVAGNPVTLTASVPMTDCRNRGRRQRPDRHQAARSGGRSIHRLAVRRPAGLTVSWMQYGGPAKVTFETTGALPVTNGQAVTTARFVQPGNISSSSSASDRAMTTRVPVTVTVQAGK